VGVDVRAPQGIRREWKFSDLDGASSGDLIGEVSGVEIGFQCTDREDELCALDFLLDLRMRDTANIDLQFGMVRSRYDRRCKYTDTTKSTVALGNGCLTHWGRIDRELRGLQELRELVPNVVAYSARVHENDDLVVDSVELLHYFVEHELFYFFHVRGLGSPQRSLQSR
jgi:hypothetical protein